MYHNYIVTNPSLCFDLIVHYTELMDESIPVFSHRHNLYEIFYGVEGEFVFECNEKAETVGRDEFILLGKNHVHRIRYAPQRRAKYFTIIFDIATKSTPASLEAELEYGEVAEALARVDKSRYCKGICRPTAIPLLDQVNQELVERPMGWLSQVAALYCQFFFYVLRAVSPRTSHAGKPVGYQNIALTVTKYIHANYADDLSIDMVSQALNVSPRHINRLMQELFGSSFAYTVNVIRMEYAKRYLLSTDDSIERIAARVGLSSGKGLTKLFKEQEGVSPAKYRALNRGQAP